MSINLKTNDAEIREKRLCSITGYQGCGSDLCKQSRCGSLRERERSFNQCSTCSSFVATCLAGMVQGTALINHGPVGCAGDFSDRNFASRNIQKARGFELSNLRMFSTNLQENDTIYGGARKLRETIERVYGRVRPKAIFIVTSCASGIIGDDVFGIAAEEEEKLKIPVIAVSCDGFRSKHWTSGFDSVFHAVIRKVVKPPRRKQPDLVNVITLWGTPIFEKLLGQLGLRPNYMVSMASYEGLETASEAVATVQMCATLGGYLATALEEVYGVPEVKTPPPYGLAGIDGWLRALGRTVGKSAEAEALTVSENARIAPKLAEYRAKFTGKTVYVTAGAAHGNGLLALFADLGFTLAGGAMFHHDPKYDNPDGGNDSLRHLVETHGDVPNYSICNKQPFELVNTLNRLKPDVLVVRHPSMAVWGLKMGIPTLFIGDEHFGLGYQGILNYGEKLLETLERQDFARKIEKHRRFPYTKWWMEQIPSYFLEP